MVGARMDSYKYFNLKPKCTSSHISSLGRGHMNSGLPKERTQYIHRPWLEIDVVKRPYIRRENRKENTVTGLVEAARALTLIGYA